MKITKAIILGAGYGKRMRPITNITPKPLIKINGITLLENSIKFLNSLGVKHIIINVHHLHTKIINFIKRKRFSPKINVVVEKNINPFLTVQGIDNLFQKLKTKSKYKDIKVPNMLELRNALKNFGILKKMMNTLQSYLKDKEHSMKA